MRYLVTLPVVGSVSVEVDACDREDAICKAFEHTSFDIEMDEPDVAFAGDFCALENVVTGNVCHAPVKHPHVERIDGNGEQS